MVTLGDGTPVDQLAPLATNVDLAHMMAGGGQVRVSTWDGELLQDEHALPDETLFKLVFIKQIGNGGPPNYWGDVFSNQHFYPC